MLALLLHRNRLHVLANDVVVPISPIAEVSANDEHVAGRAEAKARLVRTVKYSVPSSMAWVMKCTTLP
jgi:hypothetical protein